MRKILLLCIIACAVFTANAQFYVGGSVGFWSQDVNSVETTTFKFLPEGGYAFNDKWAVGTTLGYVYTEIEDLESKAFTFAPYARFSYFKKDMVRLFVDGGFDFYSVKPDKGDRVNTFSTGLKPGVALDLSKNISILAKFGFFGYQEYDDDSDGFGFDLNGNSLTFGIYYSF